jgi:Fe-S oxidoreductase
MTILDKIDSYKELLDRKAELAEETAENNKAIEVCRDELAQMMVDAECDKINRSGFTYTLQAKTRFSKKAGVEAGLFELLRDNGLGDIIRETINAQTLQGTMSEIAEDNGGELPDEYADYINRYDFMDVVKRKETRRA